MSTPSTSTGETLPLSHFTREEMDNYLRVRLALMGVDAAPRSITDDTTTNYPFPLPHPANEGADDCLRLRHALAGVDAVLKSVSDVAESKADVSALEAKADAADTIAALEGIAAEMALKANVSALESKAGVAEMTAALNLKADRETVGAHTADTAAHGLDATVAGLNTALALKADAANVIGELANKADTATVSAALALKADASTMATELAKKSNAATVTAALANKADVSALALKADVSALAQKADKATIDAALAENVSAHDGFTAALAGKAEAGHTHPPQNSVVGNAGTASKLQTARTISLSGAVKGSVAFDGSGSVSLSTTLDVLNAPRESRQALGTVSGVITVNCSIGHAISATINGNTTFVFSGIPSDGSVTLLLELKNAGAYAITWPTSVKWPNGLAPTFTTKVDTVVLHTSDGGATLRGVGTSYAA